MIFDLLLTFHQTLELFKYFTNFNKFGIIGKLPPSGGKENTMVYLKIKNKKLMLLKMAMSFLNLLSKRAIIWIFSRLEFFLIANIKLLFRSRNYINSFQRKIGYSCHFLHFFKNEGFIANGRFMGGLNFMEKLLLPETIQCRFIFT